MKIISKHKDYYDFLQGVNGIDEKVILDRTEFHITEKIITEDSFFRFYICGYRVEGLFRGGKFLYGKELEPFSFKEKHYLRAENPDDYYSIKETSNNYRDSYKKILKEPKKCTEFKNPNDYLDCPILIEANFGKHKSEGNDEDYVHQNTKKYDKFPILKYYDLIKVFSAEEIWIMLYNWLSREVPIENIQTDKQKIVSKGFDLKHSFRNTK